MTAINYKSEDYNEWRKNHTYIIKNPKVGDAVFVVIEVSSRVTIIEGVIDKITSRTIHVNNESDYKTFYKSNYGSYSAVKGYWKHVDLYIEDEGSDRWFR